MFLNRNDSIRSLKSNSFDVLIIGGGITGAGIALDAVSRGLNTALVEQNDFAFGTSSRSTKLIHGGLRYLKQLEFGLVREVGSERAIVHELSPHLVVPEKMLLPLYKKRGLGKISTSIGLKLYDWLAGVDSKDQRIMLSRSHTLSQEPLLIPKDIEGGALYSEYRTDDARLTIEVIKTASRLGVVVCNYCMVENLIYESGKISNIQVYDKLENSRFKIKSTVVVNATGPWVDLVRKKDNPSHTKGLFLSKGAHIVVTKEKLPLSQSIYFDDGNGRMIFAIPRGRIIYVGTTDTPFSSNIDEVKIEKSEVKYLIHAINNTFINVNLKLADVESSWVGLRPLIHEEGKEAHELSRKDSIFVSPKGLISIAGGKLTGYRKMAERIVDLIIKSRFKNRKFKPCVTSTINLAESTFKNYKYVTLYQNYIAQKLLSIGLSNHSKRLVNSYGKQSDQIIKSISRYSNQSSDIRLSVAELKFCLRNEMVMRASDFFVRRTGMLYFDLPRLNKIIKPCLKVMSNFHNWSEKKNNLELNDMKKLISEASCSWK